MKLSGLQRIGTMVAAGALVVGLGACQPGTVPVPTPDDGGTPAATLSGSSWTRQAGDLERPVAGSPFEVGSTVLPAGGAVEDLVLAQTFPAGVVVHAAEGYLEAWDPASGDLIQRPADCAVSGQVAICTIEGTIDPAWAIDQLSMFSSVTATAGDVDVVLDGGATDPTGADPVPVHLTTTVQVDPA